MSQYNFTFGPNGSYFLSTPIKWISYALPQKLRDLLFADIEARNLFVGLGPNNQYFYGRTTPRQGNTWNTVKGAQGNTIVNWLNSTTSGTTSVCYGPEESWIGCTSNGAASWGGLPSSFDQRIRGFHPVMATLGIGNAYVLVNGSGQIRWNLMGKYDVLDAILTNATTAIQMVALNPYAEGQFIIMFRNGMYRAMLPTAFRDAVAETINAAQKHEAEVAAIVSQSMLENSRITNNFLMNMANNMW